MADELQTVLIVDDEASIRRLVMAKLVNAGYRCVEAGNAAQAMDKLNTEPVSLVLLDVKMPGKSGIELLPEIKTHFPDTAVVMATAVADVTTAIECMQHGAYDYITKPFDLEDMLHSARRALEKRRLEIENKEYQVHLQDKVAEQAGRIRASFFNAIRALNNALEARDKYTSGHSQRVTDLAAAITRRMGLSPEAIDTIVLAGMVHDIGKIGISEAILNKPAALTDDEFREIKKHPEIGERILAPVAADEEILKLVRNHHEHFDGSGYPDGLAAEKIPLGARILAVADAFEAMTSERPYRKALSPDAAFAEIERCKGTQFDPKIAEIMLKSREGSGNK
ncbi:MAG: response regulator [Dehalococcoidales bacterium]|nr:response regulator [Dehalococcoidales bacterium]